MRIADARVVLTGATGGIGAVAAQALLAAGASVMLVGRSATSLQTQAADLAAATSGQAGSDRLTTQVADLSDSVSLAALVRSAIDWRANVLAHGAGLPAFGALDTVRAPDLDAVMQVNLIAPMQLTRALLAHLSGLPRAQVVFIGSVLGRIGVPGYSVYCASKFGLRGFSEALRRELADGPVKVQYLGPRSTRTAFNSPEVDAYNRATGTQSDTPQAVATALLQLIENEAGERFLGFPEKLAVRINGLAPAALDGAFSVHRRCLATTSASAAPLARDHR